MGLFDGKVAVITGAGGGIGRCHALAFAAEGAKVIVNDVGGARDGTGTGEAMAERVVEEIRTAGGEAAPNFDSVCTDEGAQNIIKTAVEAFGGVDIIVNNAGILRDKTLMKLELDNWNAVLDVHAKGTFLLMKYAALQMKEQGRGGKIVNTSSYAGLKGNFGQSNYACAKAGIYGLTVVGALELAKHDIQVNCIAPMAKTRMTEDIAMVPDEMKPEQISPMVLFLASSHADGMTGKTFGIHGQQIFEYEMKMNDGVKKKGDELWTPTEIAEKIDQIRLWEKPAPAAAAPARELTPKDKCDAIFKYLPEFFVAEKASGWTATIHFKVDGAGDYTINVADGKCTTANSAEGTPTCVVSLDAATFTGMADQSVNPVKAFMEGKIKASNMNDMMRFQPAFKFDPAKVEKVMAKLQGAAAAAPAAAPAKKALTIEDKCDAIFEVMPEFFVAEKAAGWTANVHFELDGAGTYSLAVGDGKCTAAKGAEGTPTCVVKTTAEIFVGMAEMKVNPVKSFMEGKIKASNMNDMMRFQSGFKFAPDKVKEVMAKLEGGSSAAAPAEAPKPTGLNFDMIGHSVSGGYSLVKAEETKAYAAATNDENAAYSDDEREGGVIAPPLFPVKLLADGLFKMLTDGDLRADMGRLVHGEQDMIFHAPIKPGDLVSMRGDIEDIIEKSSGNLIQALGKVYRDGELVCEARSGLFIRGKKKGDKKAEAAPAEAEERDELFSVEMTVDEDQTYRYAEASGDKNPIHLDPEFAKAVGLPGIILHGLCTMAFTGRAVVENAAGGDPLRLRRLKVRFAKPVLPGDTLTTTGWKVEENDGVLSIGFETKNQDGVAVITKGLAEVTG